MARPQGMREVIVFSKVQVSTQYHSTSERNTQKSHKIINKEKRPIQKNNKSLIYKQNENINKR